MNKEIPRLEEKEVKEIVFRTFPNLLETTQFRFEALSGGVINLVYKVDILGEINGDIPKSVVLKVVNKVWGTPKLENEVTLMKFLHNTISSLGLCSTPSGATPSYVPQVYSHGTVNNREYILMEHIKGVSLNTVDIPEDKKHIYTDQFAQFYAALKSFSFPPPSWGSLGCFADMKLVDKEKLVVYVKWADDVDSRVKPCNTFKDWWIGTMRHRINKARALQPKDENFYLRAIQMWEEMIKKVEKSETLNDITWGESDKLTICHTDLSESNVLVDPETYELKAVIDWEWGTSSFLSFDFEILDLGFDDEKFIELAKKYSNEISRKFPGATLGTLFPDYETDGMAKQRKFWLEFSLFASCLVSFHEWDPEDIEVEKARYAKEAQELMVEAETYIK